jgi:hypothetical protein
LVTTCFSVFPQAITGPAKVILVTALRPFARRSNRATFTAAAARRRHLVARDESEAVGRSTHVT